MRASTLQPAEQCEVPGCAKIKHKKDCCLDHSLKTYRETCGHFIKGDPARPCVRTPGHEDGRHYDARQYQARIDQEASRRVRRRGGEPQDVNPYTIPNDGVIDPIAIERTAHGDRVRLTWVEREIAAATMLASGTPPTNVEDELHLSLYKKDARCARIYAMADAIRKDGLYACY